MLNKYIFIYYMASNEYNHIQMLTFLFGGIALSALIVKLVYMKMDEYVARKQKQKSLGSGWKVIRPELTQEEVSKLLLNIEEFNETWSNLNSDFIAGDKNAKGDFTKQFNELYKSYLELMLKSESIINDKKDGLAPKNYRKFNIRFDKTFKNLSKSNDYYMMEEVLHRRLSKIKSFNNLPKPDVIIIDGGRGQYNSVKKIISNLNLSNIQLISVSKGKNRNAGREIIHLSKKILI